MKETNIAKQLGARGGKKTLEKYGKNHFKEMVNKRWAKVREEKTTPKPVPSASPSGESFFKPPQN